VNWQARDGLDNGHIARLAKSTQVTNTDIARTSSLSEVSPETPTEPGSAPYILLLAHVLVGEPDSTSPGHAPDRDDPVRRL
jgi:hypothetical protein